MADIRKAMPLLYELEFSKMPQRFLHKNKTEDGYTLGGVYQLANQHNINWKFVESILDCCDGAITRASKMLFVDDEIQDQVVNVFENNYWFKLKCDQIESQKIATEMFLLGVVAGNKTSAKIAQRIVGVEADGIIGKKSLEYLNLFNEDAFDVEFDKREVKHFEKLARENPKLRRYLDGWRNRARFY
jgi:hypothetical protein